jgi:hypothetical protein
MELSTSFQQSNHLIWSIIKFKLVQTYGTRVLRQNADFSGEKTVDCTLFSWRMVDFVHQQIKNQYLIAQKCCALSDLFIHDSWIMIALEDIKAFMN